MLRLFGRRREKLNRIQAILELNAAFLRLKNDAPAAAWFFSRSLHNALPLLKMDWGDEEKYAFIDNELYPDAANAASVDAGMATFATRVLRASVQASHQGEYELAFAGVISRIAATGMEYRKLSADDRHWPTDRQQQEFLRQQNCGSLYELKVRLQAEATSASDSEVPTQYIDAIIAAFEIKAEASSGRMWPHVQRLNDICNRL